MMISILLVACSSNGGNSGNSTPANSNGSQAEGTADQDSATSEPYQLRMAVPIFGAVSKDLEEVVAEMNKITQAEINTTIEVLPIKSTKEISGI